MKTLECLPPDATFHVFFSGRECVASQVQDLSHAIMLMANQLTKICNNSFVSFLHDKRIFPSPYYYYAEYSDDSSTVSLEKLLLLGKVGSK